MRSTWLTMAVFLIAGSAIAGYEIEITRSTGFPGTAGTIAILPASCPADVNCVSVNRSIQAEFATRPYVTTVSVYVVRQKLIDAGFENIADENRESVATMLSADSFLIVTVGSADTQQSGAVAIPVGSSVIIAPSRVARGQVEVRLIAAKDGKLLMKASGFGASKARGESGVLGKTIGRIIEYAFPRPPR